MIPGSPQPGLAPAVVAAFRRDGFVVVPSLFSAEEAAVLRAEGHATIERLSARHEIDGTWQSAAEGADAGDAEVTHLLHCHDVQFHSAAFTAALAGGRLGATFAALMGTPNVQLHHNKLFIKPAERGSPFPLHQDWPFFPHAQDSLVAAIVHLDAAPEEKGCVRVVPGSHHGGRLRHEGDIDWYLPVADHPPASATPVPAAAGDVLFFTCLTVHGSGVNRSSEARTTWLVQVRDAADEPTVDRHRSPGQGTMLAGANTTHPPPPSPFGRS
ncbi:MAG: phytanoyl-CoA dioxygenase family protein [Actinomycetota bacterium]